MLLASFVVMVQCAGCWYPMGLAALTLSDSYYFFGTALHVVLFSKMFGGPVRPHFLEWADNGMARSTLHKV